MRTKNLQGPFTDLLFRENFFPEGTVHPELLRPSAVLDIIEDSIQEGRALGIDFEFDSSGRVSMIGVANESAAAAAWWHASYLDALKPVRRLVAYAGLSADRTSINDPNWSRWEDSMLIHYLNHQDLCAMTGKSSQEDDESEAAQESYGFLNLWSATALVLPVPNWKACRGPGCNGPCPKHSPLEYCAMDAWAALMVFAQQPHPDVDYSLLYRKYTELKELAVLAVEMEKKGVPVDWQYVDFIQAQMSSSKSLIDLPFNPRSPKAIIDWFKRNGLAIPDASIETLENTRERLHRFPEHVRAALDGLIQYKRLGKGLKPWFRKDLAGDDLRLHPRVIVTGTSTGRLAMARPNLQNVPRVGWGAKVRRAVKASPGNKILKADFSQLELRVCLALAGVRTLGVDAFSWMVEKAPDMWEHNARITGRTPREVAKSVSHAADYLEGFRLLDPSDLSLLSVKRAIESGSLEVHRDWSFMGGVVSFTGVNLARRLFGSSSAENRRRALEIQRAYFEAFPEIRRWQKSVLAQVEEKGIVCSPYGRFLDLTALNEEDKAKVAVAFLGQGCAADLVQSAMIRIYRTGLVPILQVHDELVFELPDNQAEDLARQIISQLEAEDPVLGIRVPVKHSLSDTWA